MAAMTPGRKFSSTMSAFHQGGEDFLALGAAQIQADALLAAVVDGEVDALSTDHGRMPARLLATGRLDLDDLSAEVGQEHAAARPRLKSRQLEHADAVETGGHGVARTFTPAASSCSIQGDVESLSPQPRARASIMVCSAMAAMGMGTSYSRASSVARPMSLRASLRAKRTESKSPLKI